MWQNYVNKNTYAAYTVSIQTAKHSFGHHCTTLQKLAEIPKKAFCRQMIHAILVNSMTTN